MIWPAIRHCLLAGRAASRGQLPSGARTRTGGRHASVSMYLGKRTNYGLYPATQHFQGLSGRSYPADYAGLGGARYAMLGGCTPGRFPGRGACLRGSVVPGEEVTSP